MISIVIPVYNGQKYLAECIESVLSQTYTNYELLIIDDGSTDRTQEIAMSYKKKYPDKITVILKGNGGTASALNMGMQYMRGDWFKWLSADDRFAYNKALENMMERISTIPNHKDYIFYTDYNIIDEHGKKTGEFLEPSRPLIRSMRNAELMYNFYGNGSTSLIHKTIIGQIGKFREGMAYGEDLEYWLRACVRYGHTLYHLKMNTIDYRVHSQSLTATIISSQTKKTLDEIKKEYEQYLTDEQKKYVKQLMDSRPLVRKVIPFGMRQKLVKIRDRLK